MLLPYREQLRERIARELLMEGLEDFLDNASSQPKLNSLSLLDQGSFGVVILAARGCLGGRWL